MRQDQISKGHDQVLAWLPLNPLDMDSGGGCGC